MNLGRMLTDTVMISHETGRDEAGEPIYGVQSTIFGRVEHATKLLLGANGEAVDYEQIVATTEAVLSTDRLWLPGDDITSVTAARRPITVKKATTFDGATTLYEVYL